MSVGSSWNPELGFEPRPSHDVVCGLAKLEKLGALETRLGYTECGSKDRQFAAIVFCWKFKREASSSTQRRGRAVEGDRSAWGEKRDQA